MASFCGCGRRSFRLRKFLTNIVVLQQAASGLKIKMSTSSGASPINGHARHSGDDDTGHISNGDQSDSDLSDIQAAHAGGPRSESVDVAGSAGQMPSIALEDPSDSSDNDASHDADFDMEGSPVSAQSSDDARGASVESRPAVKRKSTQVLEEEFMRENPELYGLRRSVGSQATPYH